MIYVKFEELILLYIPFPLEVKSIFKKLGKVLEQLVLDM